MKRRLWDTVIQIGVFFAVILAWHLYVTWGNVPSFVLPGPGPVLAKIVEIAKNGSLWRHAGMTLYEIVVGFAFGTALGALVGYVLAHWRTLENLLQPYILFAQTAPKIALIPLFVIWFGLGMTSKIVLIVSNVFFPVMINTMLGLRSVPAELNELMTLLKASRWQRLFHIEIPSAFPLFMAGLRLAIIQATIAAIVAEWIAGDVGLGFLLVYGNTTYDAHLLLAAVVATNVVGIACYLALLAIERRLLRWQAQETAAHLENTAA